jgi:hypothetical protein
VLLAGAMLAVVLPGSGGAAWPTNQVELDNGKCTENLQLGSDRTASRSAKPTFVLWGDGGLSSYVISIDGTSLGTFFSTGGAIVCIQVLQPLSDGPHVLTGVEVAPRAGSLVTPFEFTVDTVPPAPSSQPVVSDYTDSGVLGDGITSARRINLTGVAGPREPVQLFADGITGLGGAVTDETGRWSATTVTLTDGSYSVTAVTFDIAGNKSSHSPATRLTIDTRAPSRPDAPTLGESAGGSGPVVEGRAADAARILVLRDGAPAGEAATGPTGEWRFALPPLEPGAYEIAVAAADAAGNVSPVSQALTVDVGAEPQPQPEPPPPTQAPALVPPPEDTAPALPPGAESRPNLPEFAAPAGPRPRPPRSG